MTKKLVLVVGAVLLVVVVGIAYWLKAINTLVKEAEVDNQTMLPGSTTAPSLFPEAAVVPADWRVYRNKKYGFEVRYPPSWRTKENSGINFAPSVVSLVSPETEEFIKSSLNTVGMSPAEADIAIYAYFLKDLARDSDQQITNLKDYLQKNSGPGNIVDFEETSHKGQKAYKVRLGGEGAYFAVFIDSAPYIYEILFELKANESELTRVEKQILTTFEIKP